MGDEEVPVPPQYTTGPVTDFRNAALGPVGYKMCRKRKMQEYQEQVDLEEAQMDETEEVTIAAAPAKRLKLNTVGVGKTSGRGWKEAGERAGSLRNPLLSTSWEKKMADKAAAQQFKAVKKAAVDAHKEKKQKLRTQREANLKRKEENRRKSLVTQKISNPATLKRMLKSKKDRKKLMTADTLKSV
ncbi:hypothetical protein COCSUDRAFT_53945 [Coccomyxa subellipsoidea C-169]|uniref:Coiled-coil domain-containing protein 86 n=1 Tax=Coccomyxa subellipsoidea (strain C-169) TaxID=574566 RepID=I0YUH8_COCSC|nr:hypothetical protein COCSUDRAFT_53945 [Coccomyxa subellipsoidea C-169]EIE22047.1 hypothetical protein COCSUDRAFT_53945 [Coccomyxa subellipsoidea C-169]|eukprot:XP_005646591.1 hypothetical protein COCSUDRAFT_53945 [Coccomyxa subellipsoidea C-169]